MKMSVPGFGILYLLIALVTGCSMTPVIQPVAERDGWHMRGRVAIYHEADVWNAHIDWLQQGSDFYLQLSGPLGQGIARLQGNDFGVSLQHPDGRKLFAQDAEDLLEAETGLQLPIVGLRHWVRGEALPGEPVERKNNQHGWLVNMQQSGWNISYGRHRPEPAMGDRVMPRRVILFNDTLRVKLVVDEWSEQLKLPAMEQVESRDND